MAVFARQTKILKNWENIIFVHSRRKLLARNQSYLAAIQLTSQLNKVGDAKFAVVIS
jgi:hypothetical protein